MFFSHATTGQNTFDFAEAFHIVFIPKENCIISCFECLIIIIIISQYQKLENKTNIDKTYKKIKVLFQSFCCLHTHQKWISNQSF